MPDKYYESPRIVFTDKPSYWSSEDSDFNIRQNLLRGVPYDIIPEMPIDGGFDCAHFNTLASEGKVNDGNFAKAYTFVDPAWNRFTGGAKRMVIFDLGHISAVDSWSISILYEKETGCGLPDFISVYGSVDGKGWQKLATSRPEKPKWDTDRAVMTVDFGDRYIIRYFKVEFKLELHVYCEQFELYGTKSLENAKEIVQVPDEAEHIAGYPTYDSIKNAHNVLLVYHCMPDVNDRNNYVTADEFKKIVGYYDKDGKLEDTFFDSFLFLPYTRFEFGEDSKRFEGWKYYVDCQFREGYNIDALNKVTGEIGKELGIENYKSKVFFTIMYPRPEIHDFGDIDGNGNLDFARIGDMKKAVKWMIDEQMRRYREGNYANTELGGFYWFEESVTEANREIICFAADYIHSKGLCLFWIPYYTAAGFADWKSYGFDIACMQPNYVFNANSKRERLYYNAEAAKKLGLCVELEVHWEQTPEMITKYLEYLDVGVEEGYMNTVKMYYESGAFRSACVSDNPNWRLIYDCTYKFAKERLTSEEIKKAISDVK